MKTNILSTLKGNYKSLVLVILVALFTTSCISIDTSSYSDREFKKKKYNRICVYSLDENLVYRSLLERTIVRQLTELSVDAIKGSYLFPPTRVHEDSEFQPELLKNGVDGFLKVEIVQDNMQNGIKPIANETESEITSSSYVVNDANSSKRFRFKIVLIDVKTNKVAWVGSSETFSYNLLNMGDRETLFLKFSQTAVEELQAKGHIE